MDETFTISQLMSEDLGEPFESEERKMAEAYSCKGRDSCFKVLKNYTLSNEIEKCATEIRLRTKNGYSLAKIANPPNVQAISSKRSENELISSASNLKIFLFWVISNAK